MHQALTVNSQAYQPRSIKRFSFFPPKLDDNQESNLNLTALPCWRGNIAVVYYNCSALAALLNPGATSQQTRSRSPILLITKRYMWESQYAHLIGCVPEYWALIGWLLSPGRHTNVSDSAALEECSDWPRGAEQRCDWSASLAGGRHMGCTHNTIGIITFLVLW